MTQSAPKASRIDSNLLIKRNFFTWKWVSNFSLSITLSPGSFPMIVDAIYGKFLPTILGEIDRAREIKNIKGKDLSPGSPESELFFLAGEVEVKEDQEERQEDPEPEAKQVKFENWQILGQARFHAFGENNSVKYKAECFRTSNVPDNLNLKLIGQNAEYISKELRVGLEFFSPSFASSLFGALPAVSESLYLNCNPERLSLTINSERLKNKQELPLQNGSVMDLFDTSLSTILNFEIKNDYQQRLSEN